MAKPTIKEQLEKAQAEAVELRTKYAALEKIATSDRLRIKELEDETNGLRDQLMEVTLDRENMRGYLQRAAEDEPREPLPVPPERRYASGPEPDYHHSIMSDGYGYSRNSSNERPRRWYHR